MQFGCTGNVHGQDESPNCFFLPLLAHSRKAVLSQRWLNGFGETTLIIRGWSGIRARFLLFNLARCSGLRWHHQEYHASAHFFGVLVGSVLSFPMTRTTTVNL